MMWFIIFYLTGSIISALLAMRRIGRHYNPEVLDSPGDALAYFAAFLGSWMMVIVFIGTYERQDSREDNKDPEDKNI